MTEIKSKKRERLLKFTTKYGRAWQWRNLASI